MAEGILKTEGYLPRLLKKPLYHRFNKDLAMALLLDELKEYGDVPNPLTQFYFWNRTRRHVAMSSWGIFLGKTHIFAPYLDHDVYQFLTGLPPDYLIDKRFHQETIEEVFPEYEYIPYEDKQIPSRPSHWFENWSQLWRLGAYERTASSIHGVCNPWFFYSRMLISCLSKSFYDQSKSMFQPLIYLTELLNAHSSTKKW